METSDHIEVGVVSLAKAVSEGAAGLKTPKRPN
jgi:hypothetical protein